MGIFSDAFSSRKSIGTLDIINELYGALQTKSGVSVNINNAIDVSTVFACCRVIGEGIAQVPLQLMRESKDGRSRVKAKDNDLYNRMAFSPNRWQTSFEWRELVAWHVVLTGNHFSFINRSGGKIIELYPFLPSQVTVDFSGGDISYKVTTEEGKQKVIPHQAMLHVRGPSLNGWYGLDVVKYAREAIGLAMATESAAGGLHKNGIRPSGVYSVEGSLSGQQYKDLSKWVNDNVSGVANAGKALILDRSAKWASTQMSGIDAQSIEQRSFQIEEICRFARVMPIMVGHSDKASTYASAEQMFLAHLVHTLSPWYQRLEQCFDAKLLTEKERAAGYYFNFVEEGMLRGSSIDTKETILGYVNGGILTANEGRAKLDQNPDSDPDSDKLRLPTNIVGKQENLPAGAMP